MAASSALLEGLDRADVGLWCAFLHHDTDRDGCEVDPAVGDDFAGSSKAIDDRRRDNCHVERLAGFNSLLQAARSVVVDDDLVACLRLEIRHQREHDLFEGASCQNLDLGRGTRGHRGKAQCCGKANAGQDMRFHGRYSIRFALVEA